MPHRLTFPSAGADSGLRMRVIPAAGTAAGSIYSYGDSAGFTPVFPINDAKRQP